MTEVIFSISLLLTVRIRMTHYVSSAPCSWWIIPDIFIRWSPGSLTHFMHRAANDPWVLIFNQKSFWVWEETLNVLLNRLDEWHRRVCVDWWMLFRFVTRSRSSFCHSAPFISLNWITVWLKITTGLWLTKSYNILAFSVECWRAIVHTLVQSTTATDR